MVTCKDFYEELNTLLDEGAACELKQQLEAHMRDCPNCYVVFDTARQTVSIVRKVCCGNEAAVPLPVKDRLMSRLKEKMVERKHAAGLQ